MPKLVTETIGTGDQSWIGEPGPWKARSQALKVSAFTAATHYPNGYLPSGTAVAKYTSGANSGTWGPYNSGGSDGSQLSPLFVLTDTAIAASDVYVNAALLDRGRVNINKLPLTFTPPTDPGNFMFLTQS